MKFVNLVYILFTVPTFISYLKRAALAAEHSDSLGGNYKMLSTHLSPHALTSASLFGDIPLINIVPNKCSFPFENKEISSIFSSPATREEFDAFFSSSFISSVYTCNSQIVWRRIR